MPIFAAIQIENNLEMNKPINSNPLSSTSHFPSHSPTAPAQEKASIAIDTNLDNSVKELLQKLNIKDGKNALPLVEKRNFGAQFESIWCPICIKVHNPGECP